MDNFPPEQNRALSFEAVSHNLRMFKLQAKTGIEFALSVQYKLPTQEHEIQKRMDSQDALNAVLSRVNNGIDLRLRAVEHAKSHPLEFPTVSEQINETINLRIKAIDSAKPDFEMVEQIKGDFESLGILGQELLGNYAADSKLGKTQMKLLYQEALYLRLIDSGDIEAKNTVLKHYTNTAHAKPDQ